MNVKILRQASPFAKPYWQEFTYERNDNQTVAGMLDELNYKDDLKDITGEPAPRIQWECSCLQGMCGGCAMIINHMPALACETFVRDLPSRYQGKYRYFGAFEEISDDCGFSGRPRNHSGEFKESRYVYRRI